MDNRQILEKFADLAEQNRELAPVIVVRTSTGVPHADPGGFVEGRLIGAELGTRYSSTDGWCAIPDSAASDVRTRLLARIGRNGGTCKAERAVLLIAEPYTEQEVAGG